MSTYTDIFEAAEKGTVEQVRNFVELLGGDCVNVKNDFGFTPLHRAAENSNVDVLQYLVAQGANVNVKNLPGETPLHVAAGRNSNVDVLRYLVAQGANVNVKNLADQTPLHLAARSNSIDVLKYLISQGADVNARDCVNKFAGDNSSSKTPLDYANTEEKKQILREAGGKSGTGCLVLLAVLGASLTAGICGLALFMTFGVF